MRELFQCRKSIIQNIHKFIRLKIPLRYVNLGSGCSPSTAKIDIGSPYCAEVKKNKSLKTANGKDLLKISVAVDVTFRDRRRRKTRV